MAYTEFCCKSGGSNLNAGTRTGNSTEPGTAADFTYASGNWVAGTGVFTVASGDPSADGVAAGDFASVYADGATVTGFVGRVTAVSTTTITVSLTAKMGTAPTDGTGTRTLKIGGAWQGPNGTSGFPFNVVTGTLMDASSNQTRVNFKNAATYSITAGMTHSVAGPVTFQGYTTSYGDLGKATIDGGTSGASYNLLVFAGSGGDRSLVADMIFQNNGATGSAEGVAGGDSRIMFLRCVFNNLRGTGLVNYFYAVECEAYACNKSNTANHSGMNVNASTGGHAYRCISHDHTAGSNAHGFYSQGSNSTYTQCIADTCSGHGMMFNNISRAFVRNCDLYNNGGSGIHSQTGAIGLWVENSNFIGNGTGGTGYGINISSGTTGQPMLFNNGFGAGTAANTSGQTNNTGHAIVSGTVTYPSNSTPWVDPANGDFRINLTEAKNAGRGAFTQTAASYSGTVAYPDIGAAQHDEVSGPIAQLKQFNRGTPY